jgi:hypothetical protein
MPINYKEYHPKWSLIRRYILKREGNKCKFCGAVNYSYVNKHTRKPSLKDDPDTIQIILTIGHLDQDINNNKFSNLAAMCQKCHLSHNRPYNIEKKRYGRKWKKNQLKLYL